MRGIERVKFTAERARKRLWKWWRVSVGRSRRKYRQVLVLIRKFNAHAFRHAIVARHSFTELYRRHSGILCLGGLITALGADFFLLKSIKQPLESYFDTNLLSVLRGTLGSLGGALIGATAIAFSVVMLAVQLNFARIPHGLFRKLSSDARLFGAFAGTFLLAAVVAGLSLIPDSSWAAVSVILAANCTVLILLLFFYAYRRALALINPIVQLRIVLSRSRSDMQAWSRRAVRLAPLLEPANERRASKGSTFSHDLPRVTYFQINPHWTAVPKQAVAHAMSFARRYGEQGDYEVSKVAADTVVAINATYVEVKGKTFFAHNPIFENRLAGDSFISDTLEQMRLLAHVVVVRGDEEQTSQLLRALAALAAVYATIDYDNSFSQSKEHSQLAAGYLVGVIEDALPRNMPDVVMEGMRLLGQIALRTMNSNPTDSTSQIDKIAVLSCAGVANARYRPVTLTGMEQLANISLGVLRVRSRDIGYAVQQIRNAVQLVAKTFMTLPDAPLDRTHGNYLAPYFSLAKTNTFGDMLTAFVNAIANEAADSEDAKTALSNLEEWSDGLYQMAKELLLDAVGRKSSFAFDIIHWIAHITKLLVFASRVPAADDYSRAGLEKHARWLIAVLSWIPETKESVEFAENYGVSDQLFDVSLDATAHGCDEVAVECRELLVSWAFKCGRFRPYSLEKTLRAAAISSLWKDDAVHVPILKGEIAKRLSQPPPLDQDVRDRAARELMRHTVSRRRQFATSRIEAAMDRVDQQKLNVLLGEIAHLLSPKAASEPIRNVQF